jgi:hypothetical protein
VKHLVNQDHDLPIEGLILVDVDRQRLRDREPVAGIPVVEPLKLRRPDQVDPPRSPTDLEAHPRPWLSDWSSRFRYLNLHDRDPLAGHAQSVRG